VIEFAERRDREFASWIANEVSFPRTMVDSITPATDDALRTYVADASQCFDAWPVQREAFTQWVIEDHPRDDMPEWDSVGITITDDVGAYERAKLRLLNGAHSSLAYIGSLAGIELVSEAMRQPVLANFIRTLMYDDIGPLVRSPREMDVASYIESLHRRFQNPVLPHRLSQIAWDGSQKLPFRLLGTVSDAIEAGRPIDRLCIPIAAWFQFVRRKAHEDQLVTDPLAQQLFSIGRQSTGTSADVKFFLALHAVFPDALAKQSRFESALVRAYALLEPVHDIVDLQVLEQSLRI